MPHPHSFGWILRKSCEFKKLPYILYKSVYIAPWNDKILEMENELLARDGEEEEEGKEEEAEESLLWL